MSDAIVRELHAERRRRERLEREVAHLAARLSEVKAERDAARAALTRGRP